MWNRIRLSNLQITISRNPRHAVFHPSNTMSTTNRLGQTWEERRWNQLADRMRTFHDMFKEEFDELYKLADGSYNSAGMSLKGFLQSAETFRSHLEMHHNIEETYFFPILAKKMPEFKVDAEHRESHRSIHQGLSRLTSLVNSYRGAPSTYSPKEFRECLDSFREVLFRHLDDEVKDLGAENLQRYYTLEELGEIPM